MSALLDKLAQDFSITVGELLEENAKYISDLRANNDIDIEEVALKNAAELIKSMPVEELLDQFIDCHDDWVQVSNAGSTEPIDSVRERVMKFIVETVPKTYVNVPFDVELLTISVERYREHRKAGHFLGEPNEEFWPISSSDIDNMKDYFVTMIEIACEYIFSGRGGSVASDGKTLVYGNPSFKNNVPLERYVEMFQVRLV